MTRLRIAVAAIFLAACERPLSDQEGGRSRAVLSDSALRASPGYVVDSILPPGEALRRFRVGIDSVPARLNGPRSVDALLTQFFDALDKRDTQRLRSLKISRAEFAYLVYPESRLSRPPYNQPPDMAWIMIETGSNTGFGRLLQRAGGGQVRYMEHRCPPAEADGNLRLYRNCTVRVFASGEYLTRKLFGNIVERDGRFKFVGFDTDY